VGIAAERKNRNNAEPRQVPKRALLLINRSSPGGAFRHS
jgi:hypothetical protein